MRLVKLLSHAKELADVLYAAVRLYAVLRLERLDESRTVHNGTYDLDQVARKMACVLNHARPLLRMPCSATQASAAEKNERPLV